jgi:hypothetical protein
MNGFKLFGLVIAAGFTAGTIGQIVGSHKANKLIKEAEAANAAAKLSKAAQAAAEGAAK